MSRFVVSDCAQSTCDGHTCWNGGAGGAVHSCSIANRLKANIKKK